MGCDLLILIIAFLFTLIIFVKIRHDTLNDNKVS